MTRWLLLTVSLMLGFALFSEFILQDPGYLFISLGHTQIHMRFWPAVLVLTVAGGILYWLSLFIKRVINLARGHGWQGQAAKHAFTKTQQTLWRHYFEGHWASLNKLTRRKTRLHKDPILTLFAAEAAFGLEDTPQALHWLQQAQQHHPRFNNAFSLTAARHALNQQDWPTALQWLQPLHQAHPHHAPCLALLAQCHYARQDWPALAPLLPALKRHKALPPAALPPLEEACYSGLLQAAAHTSLQSLQNAWNGLSKTQRRQSPVLAAYCQGLIQHKQSALAEPLLRRALNQQGHNALFQLYGQLQLPPSQSPLPHAEAWLEKHPQNPLLLESLGHLCAHYQHLGKARDYFEQALHIAPTAARYLHLARSHQQLGDTAKSQALYQQGLQFAAQRPAATPAAINLEKG